MSSSVLLLLNLCLQVWDGMATYYGNSLGVQEGNPLLQVCMDAWGIGVTLVSVKSATRVVLWGLSQVAHLSVSQWGLLLTATSYFMFSFLPWCVMLLLS